MITSLFPPLPGHRSDSSRHRLLILIHLITHNHHPEQKHYANKLKCPRRLPALTNIVLLQPRQRLETLSLRLSVLHIQIAVPIHISSRTPEFHAGADYSDHPEDEEDEGAEDYYAGEELFLLDEDYEDDDKDYAEGAGDDVVCEVPVAMLARCSRLKKNRFELLSIRS